MVLIQCPCCGETHGIYAEKDNDGEIVFECDNCDNTFNIEEAHHTENFL